MYALFRIALSIWHTVPYVDLRTVMIKSRWIFPDRRKVSKRGFR